LAHFEHDTLRVTTQLFTKTLLVYRIEFG